jgi:phosphoglycerate dehydrogenase-like enzyme
MRIVFCGDTFPSAPLLLRERLRPGDEIVTTDVGELRTSRTSADVVIPLMSRVDAAAMEAARCRLVQQFGTGLEGVDLDFARRQGIWVANVPSTGSNAASVAEHAILLILSLLRRMDVAQKSVRARVIGAPLGRMLAGRTVCLYGLGHTALAAAPRLRAFDVRLIGITRDPSAAKVADYRLDACYAVRDRAEALGQTDILVLCTRLCEETRGIIDAAALEALPAGALVINTARAGLVDYRALRTALESGHLSGAGLDVFWEEPIAPDDPILSLANVVATPHVAGVTEESYEEIAGAVSANIERLRRGEPPLNRVA